MTTNAINALRLQEEERQHNIGNVIEAVKTALSAIPGVGTFLRGAGSLRSGSSQRTTNVPYRGSRRGGRNHGTN